MNATATSVPSAWAGVRTLALLGLALVALVVVLAMSLWTPQWDTSLAAFAGLYAVSASHPVLVRHRTRSEFIFLNEAATATAILTLPASQALWGVLLGAALTPLVVQVASPLERMRRAPLPRHVVNLAINVLGLLPMIALAAAAQPFGLAGLVAAALLGLPMHGLISHLLVSSAIQQATRSPGSVVDEEDLRFLGAVALGSAALAIPAGLAVRSYEPDWPLLVALAVMLVTVSRVRMDRDRTSHRLSAVTDVARAFADAGSLGELETRLATTLRRVLQCTEVRVVPERPDGAGTLASRLAADAWVTASTPAMGGRWTRADQELLDAVIAVVAPQRERLLLLERTVEAERFASLVLATAGHDITNQLHTATLAIGTATRWTDRLDADARRRLADQAVRAIHRASASLRDLVAIGASGPDTTTPAAEVALFVRALGSGIHVICDNSTLAAPAAVVERALENLVRNAQRHHRGRDPLAVVITDEGPMVRIEVCDRGPGLEAEHVETLFSPFSQLADERGRRGSLGLGLFIARGLAESAGGSLDYRDRDGGGAVFTLRIPSVAKDPTERVHERIVLGPRPDRDAEAAGQPGLGREVTNEDALAE